MMELKSEIDRLKANKKSQFMIENHKSTLNAEMAVEAIEYSFESVIIAAGPSPTIIYVNPAWEKITGWSSGEVVGKLNPRILKSGKMSPQFYRDMWAKILKGELFTGEITNKRKNGSFYTAEINIFPLRLKNGETVYIEIGRDITEKKEMEQKLEDYTKNLEKIVAEKTAEADKKTGEAENTVRAMTNLTEDLENEKEKAERESVKFQTLLANVGQGLVVVDDDLKIIYINPEAQNLLGLNQKNIGKPYFEIWDMENEFGDILKIDERPITLAVREKKRIVTSKYSYVRKTDGQKFPVNVTAAPFVFGEKLGGAIAIFRDITEEKKIERAKSEFVSLASHQLRTPLTIIKWYAEMASENPAGFSPAQKEYLQEIRSGVERMATLINTIMSVSRIEMGTFASEKIKIDPAETADKAIDAQKLRISAKNLNIKKEYINLHPITVDINILKMTLDNLISNAVEYTPEKGKIEVRLEIKDNNLSVQIADNGYGIPKDEQSKIFTRFYRASNAKMKTAQGTGLGLYLVKSLLEQVRGKIWFESTGENAGATFFVELPIEK